MRRLLLALALVVLASPAWAEFRIVQSTCTVGSGTAPTRAVTFDSNTVEGNTIVVAMNGYGSGLKGTPPSITVTDSQSNAYTLLTLYEAATDNNEVRIAYALNDANSAADTVTVDYSLSGEYGNICAYEIETQAGATVDQSNGNSGASGTTATTGSIATSATTVIIAIVSYGNNGGSMTVTTMGFTETAQSTDFVNNMPFSAVRSTTTSASGAYNVTWTLGASDDWAATVIAIKDGSGAPASTLHLLSSAGAGK